MEKEGNYPESFTMKSHIGTTSADQHRHHDSSSNQMVDYMLHNPTDQQPPPPPPPLSYGSDSFDKLSFADVMQFADFGPKLALLNQAQTPADDESGIDPVYFLKFPVLNDHHKMQIDGHDHTQHLSLMPSDQPIGDDTSAELRFLGENLEKSPMTEANNSNNNNKSKRKRPRSIKTSEEVESQRMTHIAVERNRRKQMNEHLRVLRSLMPSSYVHRGDQASIIGGAIEFVRELEQLLQCLESQKRRRLYGDGPPAMIAQQPSQSPAPPPLMFPPPELGNNIPSDQQALNEYETGLREETAESKSCLADVEVKLLGFDALIKILSRRRDGQLIKTIAALEEMQLNILHTNITTIEQTVLYSFNVKIGGETRLTADDMAHSVQQIFSFIHASSSSI